MEKVDFVNYPPKLAARLNAYYKLQAFFYFRDYTLGPKEFLTELIERLEDLAQHLPPEDAKEYIKTSKVLRKSLKQCKGI